MTLNKQKIKRNIKEYFYLKNVHGSSLYNNAFYLVLNSLTTSFWGFVFWNLMARYFTPAEVGIGSGLVSASGLVAMLASLGLGIGMIRFLPQAGEKSGALINSGFTLAGIIAVLGSIVYLSGMAHWSPALVFVRESFWMSFLFVLFSVATILALLVERVLTAGRSANYVFWQNTFICLVKLPLPIFVFAHLQGYGIFTSNGAATLAGVALSWLRFLPAVYRGYFPKPLLDGKMMKQVLPYSFANYIGNLFNNILGFIYPLMVLNTLGSEENAYFYIAWMMVQVLTFIPAGAAQSLFAEGSHNQKRLGRDGRRVLAVTLLLSLPAVGVMIWLGGWLLHFFGPGYSEHGTGVMRYLALAVIPQSVNILFITVNQVKKRVHLIIMQTWALSALALGLGYWLLSRIGLSGIGAGYALANFLIAAVVVGPLLKVLRQKQISDDNTSFAKVNF
ncbi:MAG: Polysaccharide biosynthesis protein [Pelotomaculum sp. PtaU1.Bin065]|nr:MAG: Polysaccharide biosynthesis protein [Pelotomaculum sp. PtaU1.Bin065]